MSIAAEIDALREQVLARRGKKSYGRIGQELGITRNAVAGIMFRTLHAGRDLKREGRSGAKLGSGYRMGNRAPDHLPILGRPRGSKNKPRKKSKIT